MAQCGDVAQDSYGPHSQRYRRCLTPSVTRCPCRCPCPPRASSAPPHLHTCFAKVAHQQGTQTPSCKHPLPPPFQPSHPTLLAGQLCRPGRQPLRRRLPAARVSVRHREALGQHVAVGQGPRGGRGVRRLLQFRPALRQLPAAVVPVRCGAVQSIHREARGSRSIGASVRRESGVGAPLSRYHS
eukprot:360758-Chlamydomonas_euryale.AAC.1